MTRCRRQSRVSRRAIEGWSRPRHSTPSPGAQSRGELAAFSIVATVCSSFSASCSASGAVDSILLNVRAVGLVEDLNLFV
jgi:hypothetical protein